MHVSSTVQHVSSTLRSRSYLASISPNPFPKSDIVYVMLDIDIRCGIDVRCRYPAVGYHIRYSISLYWTSYMQ